jgi:sporulation protein YlmC with PRC-barrel domain
MKPWHDRESIELYGELLDRQILDPNGVAVGKVDDLELRYTEDGRLQVTDLVIGVSALVERTSGWAGKVLRTALRLSRSHDEPRRIPFDQVTDVSSAVIVSASAAEGAASLSEEGVRRLLERIPGARHASK